MSSILRVGIDATTMLVGEKNGWQNYAEALVLAIARQIAAESDVEVHLYFHLGNPHCNPDLLHGYLPELESCVVHTYGPGYGYYLALPAMNLIDRLDLLHLPVGALLRVRTCPVLLTMHDVCPRRLALAGNKEMEVLDRAAFRMVKQASGFIADSCSSKSDLVALYNVSPDRVWAVPLGTVSRPYPDPGLVECVRRKYDLGDYILCVSSLQYRKNHLRLLDAFQQLKTEFQIPHQLVLVGGDGPGAPQIHTAIADSSVARDVRILGYVPNRDMSSLYSGSALFVYPSICEGFGLPLLEAMANGAVVAAADATSIPEVCGDAALLFDPYHTDAIAGAMLQGLHDEQLRQELCEKGQQRVQQFSWEQTARKTLQCYRSF